MLWWTFSAVAYLAVWSKTQPRGPTWRCWWWVPRLNFHSAQSFVFSLIFFFLLLTVPALQTMVYFFGFLPESHLHQTIRSRGSGLCRLFVQNHGPQPAQHAHPRHWVNSPQPPRRTPPTCLRTLKYITRTQAPTPIMLLGTVIVPPLFISPPSSSSSRALWVVVLWVCREEPRLTFPHRCGLIDTLLFVLSNIYIYTQIFCINLFLYGNS